MNADDIERVRKIVNQDGLNIFWIGAKMPCEFFDEEVEFLYEDMNGQPCICYAIYTNQYKICVILLYLHTFKRLVSKSNKEG